MSSDTENSSSQPEGLQFDHAEFEQEGPPTLACSSCQRTIEDEYFDINGAPVCAACRDGVEAHFRGGSKIARVVRSLLFGGVAALIGAVGYFSFIHFLNLDWSLISVLVGYLVGTSVRKGSGGRGGWIYQLLAVVLTYLAIGLTYSSVAVAQLWDVPAAVDQVVPEGGVKPGPVDDAKPGPADDANPGPGVDPEALERVVEAPDPDGPQLGLSLLVRLVGVMLLIPVLLAKENPITLLIIGFALWEAWKLNKRLKIAVSGPYRVGDLGDRAAEAGAHA